MISLHAWRFFFEHAGYSVPPGEAPCAIALACASSGQKTMALNSGSKMT